MIEPQKCDLHIHSIYSDSNQSVESIFRTAKEKKLRAIAITDHDTVEGIPEAAELSRHYGVELVNGIEFSCQHLDSEVHVLGFFIDDKHKVLRETLDSLKESRHTRLMEMIAKLQAFGLKIDQDEILAVIDGKIATRLHLGVYLAQKGYAANLNDSFRQFLAPGKPGYVARFKHTVKDAAALIHDAGGLAFLAHPQLLPQRSWIEDFVKDGIDGIEAAYPRLSPKIKQFFSEFVKTHKVLRCGGSDAHGSYKEFTSVGSVDVPYAWVEEMKTRLNYVQR